MERQNSKLPKTEIYSRKKVILAKEKGETSVQPDLTPEYLAELDSKREIAHEAIAELQSDKTTLRARGGYTEEELAARDKWFAEAADELGESGPTIKAGVVFEPNPVFATPFIAFEERTPVSEMKVGEFCNIESKI